MQKSSYWHSIKRSYVILLQMIMINFLDLNYNSIENQFKFFNTKNELKEILKTPNVFGEVIICIACFIKWIYDVFNN